MHPCAFLVAMCGASVYWKAEFPPKGAVDGTPVRKHLAEHQETGWAGSTPLKKFTTFPFHPTPLSPPPGELTLEAWPSLPAHSPQITSSKSGSATFLD